MGEFRMPSLGADMDVGTIVEWLVKPGEAVQRGQIVAVVDTAKAAIEIEAFEDGVLAEILVGPGKQVPVGTPLALIGSRTGSEAAPSRPVARDVARPAPPPHPRATPPIRHLAHQLGVDLDAVSGTGPDGRITHDDLVRSAPRPEPGQPEPDQPEPDQPEPDQPEPDQPEPDQPEPDQPEPDQPEPDQPEPTQSELSQDRGPVGARTLAQPAQTRRDPGSRPGDVLRVSPRARRIAAERGVDLATVAGSGAGGAVLGADVESAADQATTGAGAHGLGTQDAGGSVAEPGGTGSSRDRSGPAPTSGSADPKAAMRTAIANLMARSNTEIPHYYVSQTIDLAAALAWLAEHNTDLPAARRVLPAALFLRATVLAAQEVPDLNAHWVEGELRPCARVDLGVAVATRGGGLVTPAIPDVGQMRIDDLMAALVDLVRRARRGKLRQGQMAGASITVSSLGETGPDALFGVIFPPQVALVGVGGIVQRPWAVDGMLAVRPTSTITVAADHRATDGRTASAFLATFDRALQNPEEL